MKTRNLTKKANQQHIPHFTVQLNITLTIEIPEDLANYRKRPLPITCGKKDGNIMSDPNN